MREATGQPEAFGALIPGAWGWRSEGECGTAWSAMTLVRSRRGRNMGMSLKDERTYLHGKMTTCSSPPNERRY